MATEDERSKERLMIQAPNGDHERAIKILAKSIFKELKSHGYETRQIVSLSSELLELVTSSFRPAEKDSGSF